MTYANLLYEVAGAVVTITVARQQALNALNAETMAELRAAFVAADADPAVRAIILTGQGEKAFVAGADIAAMKDLPAVEGRRFALAGRSLGDAIENLGKPVIAAVNGFALGGGCELALACDFIYASQKAKFGQPEVNLGVMPGFGGSQRLPRRIGVGRAMELILTGDLITAEEAHRIGLVNKICAPESLMAEARATAEKIASKAPQVVAFARRAVRKSEELPLPAGNDLEAELFGLLFSTADQKEGMRAFLEKRPPQFTGQ